MADETVEHVVVEHAEHEAEAVAVTAGAAVATAEAAAALANQTAAAAELQAAELVHDTQEEALAWQSATARQVSEHGQTLQTISEQLSSLTSREDARHAAIEDAINRLAAVEALILTSEEAPPQSTPPPSEETNPATGQSGDGTVLGAATEVTAGPIETGAEASLGGSGANAEMTASLGNPPPSRRRRRWI